MKIKLFFTWYNFWIGWYWDRKNKVLYACPIPTIVIKIWNKQITEDIILERTLFE